MKSIKLIFLILISIKITQAKNFEICELVEELSYSVKREDIHMHLCVIGTSPSTSKLYSGLYGIYKIGGTWWCGKEAAGGDCGIKCENLLDENIEDDVRCAETIIDIQGLEAWGRNKKECKLLYSHETNECLKKFDEKIRKFGTSTRKTTTRTTSIKTSTTPKITTTLSPATTTLQLTSTTPLTMTTTAKSTNSILSSTTAASSTSTKMESFTTTTITTTMNISDQTSTSKTTLTPSIASTAVSTSTENPSVETLSIEKISEKMKFSLLSNVFLCILLFSLIFAIIITFKKYKQMRNYAKNSINNAVMFSVTNENVSVA